jgi:hypothetical protein
MALYLQASPAAPFELLASYCTGVQAVTPLASLVPGVRGRLVALLPAVRPRAWPPGGSVVNLPVVLAAGQAAGFAPVPFLTAGYPVRIQASQVFSWSFGDGAQLSTANPGGPWPDDAVVHPYTGAGRFAVGLTVVWSATFTVADLGPFPVTGPAVTQQAGLTVEVRPAAAVLVAG